MGKKKNKIASTLKTIVSAIKDKPSWDIDFDKIKTFEELHEAVDKFKLILESNVGNRDEDVAYAESREISQDANGWDSISDTSGDSDLVEQIHEGVNTY